MTDKKPDPPTLYITGLRTGEFARAQKVLRRRGLIENARCWMCGRGQNEEHVGILVTPVLGKAKQQIAYIPKNQLLQVQYHSITVPGFQGVVKVPMCQYCVVVIKKVHEVNLILKPKNVPEEELSNEQG